MSVASTHPRYSKRLPQVHKTRDFIDGRVEKYVRKLPGQDEKDYVLYRDGAYYLPALARTQDAFVGMVMSPLPEVNGKVDAHKPFLDDLTSDGEPFSRVAQTVVTEVIESARCAVLVDYPQAEEGLTMSDAQRAGLRPYATFYRFEDIINWKMGVVRGRKVLTQIRLMESYETGGDEWDTETDEQIRVLDLEDGKYRVRVYRKKKGSENTSQAPSVSVGGEAKKTVGEAASTPKASKEQEWEQFGEDVFPKMRGRHLEEIPIVIFGPSSLDPARVEEPPLYDMVRIAESHLNDSALRQWALMWCGAPTLVIAGGLEDEPDEDGNPAEAEPIRIGSSQAIELGEGGSAQLLEMGADSVGAIKSSMDDKRRDMAAVGARVLSEGGSSNIATETALLERVGEHSVLAGIANTAGDGLTKVLTWLFEWGAVPTANVAVEVNTDFIPAGLKPGELSEWVAAVQAGEMPRSVFIARLKERGAVDSSMDQAEWERQLDNDNDDLGLGDGEGDDDGGEGDE